jgi:hypothetical protein
MPFMSKYGFGRSDDEPEEKGPSSREIEAKVHKLRRRFKSKLNQYEYRIKDIIRDYQRTYGGNTVLSMVITEDNNNVAGTVYRIGCTWADIVTLWVYPDDPQSYGSDIYVDVAEGHLELEQVLRDRLDISVSNNEPRDEADRSWY